MSLKEEFNEEKQRQVLAVVASRHTHHHPHINIAATTTPVSTTILTTTILTTAIATTTIITGS